MCHAAAGVGASGDAPRGPLYSAEWKRFLKGRISRIARIFRIEQNGVSKKLHENSGRAVFSFGRFPKNPKNPPFQNRFYYLA